MKIYQPDTFDDDDNDTLADFQKQLPNIIEWEKVKNSIKCNSGIIGFISTVRKDAIDSLFYSKGAKIFASFLYHSDPRYKKLYKERKPRLTPKKVKNRISKWLCIKAANCKTDLEKDLLIVLLYLNRLVAHRNEVRKKLNDYQVLLPTCYAGACCLFMLEKHIEKIKQESFANVSDEDVSEWLLFVEYYRIFSSFETMKKTFIAEQEKLIKRTSKAGKQSAKSRLEAKEEAFALWQKLELHKYKDEYTKEHLLPIAKKYCRTERTIKAWIKEFNKRSNEQCSLSLKKV